MRSRTRPCRAAGRPGAGSCGLASGPHHTEGAGTMSRIFWGISLGLSVIAGLMFWSGMQEAESAPQQAAVASVALGVAVIPYCVARAVDGISGTGKD